MKPSQIPQMSRAAKAVHEVFLSGRPLTYIRSAEEQRVGLILREVAASLPTPTPIYTWSLTEGLRLNGVTVSAGAASPRGVLDHVISREGAGIFHLQDFHEPLRESPEIRRRLRDVYQSCLDQQKFVVISSPVRFIPEEVDRSIVFLDLRPPDLIELTDFIRSETGESDEAVLHSVASALQGLTLDEARYALRRALATTPKLGPESLPALLEEKRLLVNRTGVIEFISTATEIGEVGGLEGLKTWLLERRKLFDQRDSLSAEIVPKGLLMMGIPGCGKSLCVKAIEIGRAHV